MSKVPLTTIDKGIQRESDVLAKHAVQIAHALNLPVEQLLGLDFDRIIEQKNGDEKEQIKRSDIILYFKYKEAIKQLELMQLA